MLYSLRTAWSAAGSINENWLGVKGEIPFNRHFYTYTPPRPLEEIEADIKAIEQEIAAMLREVTQ